MNWNKQKLLKNISKIKQFFKSLSRGYKVDKLVHNCKAIKDFNNKFPNLFTLGEINYWYKNFDSLTSKIFYCKVCGKPVRYQNFKYNEYCSRKCAANSENYKNSLVRFKDAEVDIKYWTKDRIYKEKRNIIKCIKRLICKFPHTKTILPKTLVYREFLNYYPNLLTAAEFGYWFKNIDNFDPNIFFCKECGNRVNFQGYYPQYCSYFCANHSPLIKEKIKQTNLKKRGVEWSTQDPEIWAKIESTNLKRYGCKNPLQNKEFLEKMKATNRKRYGVPIVNQSKEIQQHSKDTCKKLYGKEFYSSTDEFKQRMTDTKRKNGTFNTSQPEEYVYILLYKTFGKRNIKRQYRSENYPFNCDFYLPKFDLRLELNGSWTHGLEPYNPRKKAHKDKLKDWIRKSKNSDYYKKAIEVWTLRDVEKRKVAKNNNVRLIEFWSVDQVNSWIERWKNAKRFSVNMLKIT